MEPLQSNQRVFLAGRTGCGKTYLARQLTASLPRLVVIDSKGTLGDWNLEAETKTAWRRLRRGEGARLRILADFATPDYWDRLFYTLYKIGNLTVYIDELYAVNPPGVAVIPALGACYTRGRELGVGVWAATQRPAWVPLVTMSEADHYFIFRLALEEDRKRISKIIGPEVLAPITARHGFYYYHTELDRPVFYRQLTEKG